MEDVSRCLDRGLDGDMRTTFGGVRDAGGLLGGRQEAVNCSREQTGVACGESGDAGRQLIVVVDYSASRRTEGPSPNDVGG